MQHPQRARLRLTIAILVGGLVCGFADRPAAWGQKLNQIGEEIRGPGAPQSPADRAKQEQKRRERDEKKRRKRERERSSRQYLGEDQEDDDATLGELVTAASFYVAGALTQAVFIGDPRSHGYDINYEIEPAQPPELPTTPPLPAEHTLYFSHYPYADGFDGYTMQSNFVPARPLTAATQLQFAFGSDFDSLQWYTGKGLFEWSRSRFGFDAEWTYFTENLGPGQRDELHVGDVNLLWRRIQSQKWLLRWGLGMTWAHDSDGTDAGLNGTLKVDYFPRRPWVISGEYDLGRLGNATAQHLQLGVGATWRHFELFSAYDYRRFGGTDISGPVFGMRFWW